MIDSKRPLLVAVAAAATLFVGGSASASSLQNPDFSIPDAAVPPGEPTTTPALCPPFPTPGPSAAEGWTTYANTVLTSINTWLTMGPAGIPSILVAVGGGQGGLVQNFEDMCEVTEFNHVSGWIYVVAGQVELQLGNGGAGGGESGVTETTGKWEFVDACGRPDMRNNEVTIYGVEPSVFYAYKINVDYSEDCLSCPHTALEPGEALSPDCGRCEAAICDEAFDPYCCSGQWDALCVAEATFTTECLECPL